MEKVNDTITLTTAANQEKTPQQAMAEEAAQQQPELPRASKGRQWRSRRVAL